MDPVPRILELIEALHRHEDGIQVLEPASYRRVLRDLERLLRQAFPSYPIPEIIAALRGDRMPLPPRWWEVGWEMTSPSPEEILLSVVLGQRDTRYLPEDVRDPLGDAYRRHVENADLPAPASPVLFAVAMLVEALLWGWYRVRLIHGGSLRSLREVIRERFGADDALLDGVSLLARREEGMSWEQKVAAFLALPGAAQLVDRMLTLYGDLLTAKGVSDSMVVTPAPIPTRDTTWFRQRLLQVYRVVGSVSLAAKAMRLRKAAATALIREMEGKNEHAQAS